MLIRALHMAKLENVGALSDIRGFYPDLNHIHAGLLFHALFKEILPCRKTGKALLVGFHGGAWRRQKLYLLGRIASGLYLNKSDGGEVGGNDVDLMMSRAVVALQNGISAQPEIARGIPFAEFSDAVTFIRFLLLHRSKIE